MAVEIRVPALGESIVEATVGRWLKQEGDQVAAGEALIELETDKVNIEVTAEASGTLAAISQARGRECGDRRCAGDDRGGRCGGQRPNASRRVAA